MALTRFSGDADIISQLSDQPNDNDGLSAQQLKGKFDQFAEAFKTFFNGTHLQEVEDGLNAAAGGVSPSGMPGSSIQDGTITSNKLSSTTGAEAVDTSNIKAGAVSLPKLSTEVQSAINAIGTKASFSQLQVVLQSGQTEWTVAAAGVRTTNPVIVTAGTDETSHDAWITSEIRATEQSYNQMTFVAKAAPQSDVTVNLLIFS